MILYPAIDLKDGKCVRLYQGDMNQATIFNNDPVAQALEFENFGFKHLHIVDLDGAVSGNTKNQEVIKNIIKHTNIKTQLGGGIRSLSDINKWLNIGVDKIIIGTLALTNIQLVQQACLENPDKIIIGIDAKNGHVATQGWVETSKISAIDLAQKYQNCSANAIIYTDIAKDGTLSGPNIKETLNIAQNSNIAVIASGGISNINDIIELEKYNNKNIKGAIIGRALYDKKITIEQLRSEKLL